MSIRLRTSEGADFRLQTIETGGSQTRWIPPGHASLPKILGIPSRRHFEAFFGPGYMERETYLDHHQLPQRRGGALSAFTTRLFRIQDHREEFDKILGQIISPLPSWHIELSDHGEYYLKFDTLGQSHNSEGVGDGIISLFFLVDALYETTTQAPAMNRGFFCGLRPECNVDSASVQVRVHARSLLTNGISR